MSIFFLHHLLYSIFSDVLYRILPFGAVHAVVTVEDLKMNGHEASPGPALMFGGSGFLRTWMEASLAHGIRYAIWHQDWSNSNHDDFVVTIARMLQWQLLFPRRGHSSRPFSGRNLHALVMMGFLHHALCSLPYDENHRFTALPQVPGWQREAGEKASSLANAVLEGLSAKEKASFNAFRSEYLSLYVEEMTHKGDLERKRLNK